MKTKLIMDAASLALVARADAAESELLEMGCKKSPSRDRLWIVPRGKLRAAQRITKQYLYSCVLTGF